MAAKLKESVNYWKKKLERIQDEEAILNYIHKLSKVPMTLEILQETHVGKCIRNLSKRDDIVGEKAKSVLNKWRVAFASASNSTERTKSKSVSVKENVNKESSFKSSSKNNASYEKTVKHHQKEFSHHESKHKHQKNSSHNSSSQYTKTELVNGSSNGNSSDESSPSRYTYEKKDVSSKYISYDPHTDISEGYNPECPEINPGNTHEPSHLKRKYIETEFVKESKSKKLKSEYHSNSLSDQTVENKKKEKMEKHDHHHKSKSKNATDSVQYSNQKRESSSKVNIDDREKNKSSHSDVSRKSKSKESNENKTKSSKSKLKINSSEEFTSTEVSFEDCLGFNDIVIKKKKNAKLTQSIPKKPVVTNSKPSPQKSNSHSSRHTNSKKSSPAQDKEKVHVTVPKPKELKLEEVDIMSTLPQTLPNYRPLPRVELSSKRKEVLSNEDAILFMSSKREKTAVYSGRRTFYTEVPTLVDCCIRVLIENIDAIEYFGELPYMLLKPVLEKGTPAQLYNIENFNPSLLDETHELWEIHCKRDFKLLSPQENETYRELYLRAQEEQERKLKCITANISASMSKSNPVRQVKLAYVDSFAKPPRDVARKQAKNGTAVPVSQPVKTGPPSKATARPVAPVVNTVASSSVNTSYPPKKPKVAPLMAKTLKSMKQCFRRK